MAKTNFVKAKIMDEEVGHAYIPAPIMARKDLTAGEKLLIGRIIGLTKEKGYCYASNGWLGKQINLSGKTVSNMISKFVKNGIVEIEIIKDEKGQVKERKIYPSGIYKGVSITQWGGIHYPMEGGIHATMEESIKDISLKEKNNTYVEIFNHYLTCFKKNPNQYKLYEPRVNKIKARLKSFSIEQIKQAITNASLDDFYSGRKEGLSWPGATFDWIMENDVKLERMLNLIPKSESRPKQFEAENLSKYDKFTSQ